MRLIEADKLLKQLEWLDTDDFILYEEVKKDIDEMPTVKAIPIEWIEKYIWSADTHEEKETLRKMYISWENENDRD